MVKALHFDGMILLIQAVALVWLGCDYHRWRFRVPIFAMAFCDLALALTMLAIYRPSFAPHWLWLRLLADGSSLVIIAMYIGARRSHPAPLRQPDVLSTG